MTSSRKTWLAIAGICAAVVALYVAVLAAQSGDDTADGTTPAANVSNVHQVQYLITGSATGASVTVQTPTGMSQMDVDVPMKNKNGDLGVYMNFPAGASLYISGQITGDAGGDLECEIRVDGQTVSSNTASGFAAIASCSGRS